METSNVNESYSKGPIVIGRPDANIIIILAFSRPIQLLYYWNVFGPVDYVMYSIHKSAHAWYFNEECTLYVAKNLTYWLYCTIYSVYCTMYSVVNTLDFVWLYTIHYTLYTIHYTLFIIHYTVYTLSQYTRWVLNRNC